MCIRDSFEPLQRVAHLQQPADRAVHRAVARRDRRGDRQPDLGRRAAALHREPEQRRRALRRLEHATHAQRAVGGGGHRDTRE
eukprot:4475510-Prymnesium_polylepis.1